MKHTNVGRSGLVVGQLGLGTLTWGRDTDEGEAKRMLSALLDHGGNVVDVSPIYGEGLAEEVLGRVLADTVDREEVVIVAHAGLTIRDSRVLQRSGRGDLMASLDRSLTKLGTTYVDVLNVAAPDPNVPFEEIIETVAGFVQQGAVRYIGLANHAAWQVARTAQYLRDLQLPHLTSLNADYSLLNREIEDEIRPAAHEFGLGVFAQAPLGGGVLTGKYRHTIPATSRAATEHLNSTVAKYMEDEPRRIVEAVAKAADGLGRTPADISLSWLMHQPEVASVLCGARTGAQFEQLLSMDDSALPGPVHQALTEITA